ncbi:hypothetical protein THALO_40112 [Tenacibaculum halocynthiae]
MLNFNIVHIIFFRKLRLIIITQIPLKWQELCMTTLKRYLKK